MATAKNIAQIKQRIEYYLWSLKKTAYRFVRAVYRKLPPSISSSLQGVRFRFIRWAKSRALPAPDSSFHPGGDRADISWEEFSKRTLSRRSTYRGVFIQESGVDWNIRLYQRPQHICTAFGRAGYLVIYRIDNWSDDDVNGFREVSENVWVTNRPEVDRVENAVRSFYSTSYQLTPRLLERHRERGVLVYEYIDHIDEQISGDHVSIKRLLELKDFAFSGGVDFVVASAKGLEEEAIDALGRDRVILVPNGVDTVHYRSNVFRDTVIPEALASFRESHSNIIGYFGAIAPWLWYDMVSELAKLRPDLGFVFIGPDYNGSVGRLPKAKNVLHMAEVDYSVLPAYAYQFDVCFIPFAPGDIARTTSPLKLFEYFALEKPVVVTSEMVECVAFEEVFSGDSAEKLSLAIDKAVDMKSNYEYLARLRHLADENDWKERVRAMEVVFDALPQRDRIPEQ